MSSNRVHKIKATGKARIQVGDSYRVHDPSRSSRETEHRAVPKPPNPTWNAFNDLSSDDVHQNSLPRDRRDFKIAIICALPLEATAIQLLFDKWWDAEKDGFFKDPEDPNAYSTGLIGHHNVVLVHMPGIGKVNAASAAAYSRLTFKEIRLALVVGVCGGIPFGKGGEETFLGDVVISNCIVQYDLGRQYSDQLIRKDTLSDSLGRPNSEIRAILAKLQTMQGRTDLLEATADNLSTLSKALGPVPLYPGRDQDKLFDSRYRHKHQSPSLCETCTVCIGRNDPVCGLALESTCEDLGCDEVNLIPRQLSKKNEVQRSTLNRPAIHFGPIGSADSIMKSGELRDILSTRERFIALEMEAAGVWDIVPCLVIKGICDYADSHKSKEWQNYAAAAAAACTKAFLAAWDRAY